MASNKRLQVLAVGGNPISAFLAWRLQATNATDVTLVWKAGFENVSQYGISFKSSTFDNERFKPRSVVRSPEDAASNKSAPFDYVILCVKALPDLYDLASVVESVVTPQHTCLIVNTTSALGLESALEERFPTNVVLSLVCHAEVVQLGPSEFEHKNGSDIWVGAAGKNPNISASVQSDMAQALSMTLSTGQVNCQVSSNIRQFQYERMIGPAAFHPASVVFETSNHSQLLEKVGVKEIVHGIIDELIQLATAQGCSFKPDFKQKVIADMTASTTESAMFQDFVARRPMEVENYLGSPIKLAAEAGVQVPRISTMYAIVHNLNIVNRQGGPRIMMNGGPPVSPTGTIPRMPSATSTRGMVMNGAGMRPPQQRPRMSNAGPNMGPPVSMMPGGGRRPPPPGARGPPMPSSRAQSRRGSLEGGDLDEFAHLALYDESMIDGGANAAPESMALRERELALRQRELALREQELRMRRSAAGPPPSRRGGRPIRNSSAPVDEDDDDDDYVDPTALPPNPNIDPETVDMMSLTSRKNRKAVPSQASIRGDPEGQANAGANASRTSRFRFGRGRASTTQMNAIPTLGSDILDDPLMGYSSNRYGNVDRGAMAASSRANSLTASVMNDYSLNGVRRTSHSPGNAYPASVRGMPTGRPSPPNGYPGPNGRPSTQGGLMPQAGGRFPQGVPNGMPPQQVEQQVGVRPPNPNMPNQSPYPYNTLNPNKQPKSMQSLTGRASASGASGESGASANSSQSSFGPRSPAI